MLALIAVSPDACLTCVRRVGRDESRKFCATAVVDEGEKIKNKKRRRDESRVGINKRPGGFFASSPGVT